MANAATPKRPVLPHPSDSTAALVELTRGYWAVIDAADAKAVGRFNWCAKVDTKSKTIYALRAYRVDGILRSTTLHRFIASMAGLSGDEETDHRNGNGLDCRRHNLRDATTAQNARNSGVRSDSKTGIKGVSWNRARRKWEADVRSGDARRHRQFESFAEAVAFADAAREELHGEFANHGTRKELLS